MLNLVAYAYLKSVVLAASYKLALREYSVVHCLLFVRALASGVCREDTDILHLLLPWPLGCKMHLQSVS